MLSDKNITNASENLFQNTATYFNSFSVRIGLSKYRVEIPSYEHGTGQYIPEEDIGKILPIVEALNRDDFLKPNSFLKNQIEKHGESLNKLLDAMDSRRVENGRLRFTIFQHASEYNGIWPAVEILAAAADRLQDKEGLTSEEIEFWSQHVGCVKNKLGLADTFNLTNRSRLYRNTLTSKIMLPESAVSTTPLLSSEPEQP